MMMLIQSPDITITICAGDETPWITEKYKYASELALVHLVSAAAYIIAAAGKADEKAAHLAGLEGAIRAYQAIVAQNPKAKLAADGRPDFQAAKRRIAEGVIHILHEEGLVRRRP